jgi:hypothetical protein
MSPNLSLQGALVGKDRDECERAEAAGSDEPNQSERGRVGSWGGFDGGELPASKTDLEAVSGGGSSRAGASELVRRLGLGYASGATPARATYSNSGLPRTAAQGTFLTR